MGLDLSCAPEIRRNTKDDRKRASSIRSLLFMRLCCGTPRATAYGKRGNPGLRPAQANGPQSKDRCPQSRYARRYYAALTAKAVISGAGAASMFGKQRTQVWGRPAQQAENRAAIPKKSDRWLIELARIRQLSAFSLAPDGSLQSPIG